jgi:thioredoxin reductase/Pyruvate/2-oxoacid:ferredoxin oxidoreductase delta subunit
VIDSLIYLLVALIAVVVPGAYFLRYRKHQSRARLRQEAARASGMTEPASLHPKIDPNKCICSAGCTAACPEGGIIGILGGTAELVSPTRCIGHGACAEACPVDAITLVFGTETRGVDIPHVGKTFETNVPGIYIAGELGGMGLIRNAVTQGREAAEYIARSLGSERSEALDLVIVGAGPAGLSAALQAKKEKLNALLLEQGGGVGGTLLSYPRQKLVMTQPMEIPLHGKFHKREASKEELVELWEDIVRRTGVRIQSNERVLGITPSTGYHVVRSNLGEYRARRVLLAIGRRGTPRRLGVPGEDSSRVAYKLLEPEQYEGRKMLVVGGGDSAVEAALALSRQQGTEVALSYRKEVFSRLKDKNREDLSRAIDSGRLRPHLATTVESIGTGEVTLRNGDSTRSLENDYVLVFIGGELPTAFLQGIGIRMERKFGER